MDIRVYVQKLYISCFSIDKDDYSSIRHNSFSFLYRMFFASLLVYDLLLFHRPLISDSSRPYGWQHTKPLCPSTSPEVCPSSSPLHRWCHPAISSSNEPLLSSIFSNIRAFSSELALWIRWPKYWSFNFSISPSNKYSGFIFLKIDWFDLLALQGDTSTASPRRLSRVFSSTAVQKHQFFGTQPSLWSNSHIHTWLLEKP